jgi:hypothetical protein
MKLEKLDNIHTPGAQENILIVVVNVNRVSKRLFILYALF